MAQAKFIDDDLFSWAIEQAQNVIPEIEKKALAAGAKVIADEMKKRLRGVIADKSATELVNAFGITPAKQNTTLNWNVHLGFDGYQKPGYGKFPEGVPFQLLGRTFESGAVYGGRARGSKPKEKNAYWRQPKPFAAPAVRATKDKAIYEMRSVVEAELDRLHKGG